MGLQPKMVWLYRPVKEHVFVHSLIVCKTSFRNCFEHFCALLQKRFLKQGRPKLGTCITLSQTVKNMAGYTENSVERHAAHYASILDLARVVLKIASWGSVIRQWVYINCAREKVTASGPKNYLSVFTHMVSIYGSLMELSQDWFGKTIWSPRRHVEKVIHNILVPGNKLRWMSWSIVWRHTQWEERGIEYGQLPRHFNVTMIQHTFQLTFQ